MPLKWDQISTVLKILHEVQLGKEQKKMFSCGESFQELLSSEITKLFSTQISDRLDFLRLLARYQVNDLSFEPSASMQKGYIDKYKDLISSESHGLSIAMAKCLRADIPKAYTAHDLKKFINEVVTVSSVDAFNLNFEKDLFYYKINHGFWEKIRFVLCPIEDQVEQRSIPFKREKLSRTLFKTGFVHALHSLHQWNLSFPHKHILPGFSLGNGACSHSDILQSWGQSPRYYIWGANTIHSFNAWIRVMPSVSMPVSVAEGAFPKLTSMDHTLGDILLNAASNSDEILFIVPSFLDGIHLRGASIPTDQFLIHPFRVHEVWAPTIAILTKKIFSRLSESKRILIFVQAGSFSALIALFLAKIRIDCGDTKGKILLFDLGQVFNVFMEEKKGPWAKQGFGADSNIFHWPN